MKLDSKINEFSSVANNSPGYSYCRDGEGCWANGCGICTNACIFYRTFAVADTETIYEIFSCPSWTSELSLSVEISIKDKPNRNLDISLGNSEYTDSISSISLKLLSSSVPPLPILNTKFIDNSKAISLIDASAAGTPQGGHYGQLQCGTRDKAKAFDCFFVKEACSCRIASENAVCDCFSNKYTDIFENKKEVLPLSTHGVEFFLDKERNVLASVNHLANVQVQISMSNLTISTTIAHERCEVVNSTLSGCYNCISAANLSLTCISKKDRVVGEIQCNSFKTMTHCSPDSTPDSIKIAFKGQIVNEKCTVQCGKDKTDFIVRGVLDFVETVDKQLLEKIGHHNIDATDNRLNMSFLDIINLIPTSLIEGIKNIFSFPHIALYLSVAAAIFLGVVYLIYIKPYLSMLPSRPRSKGKSHRQ